MIGMRCIKTSHLWIGCSDVTGTHGYLNETRPKALVCIHSLKDGGGIRATHQHSFTLFIDATIHTHKNDRDWER